MGIFLDFSKAFDTVNHDILLKKIVRYGIRGKAFEWFKNYLQDRKQYTHINGKNSKFKKIKTGVPQGSILGPLLFLIYINDIYKSSLNLNFILFADDTTMYTSGTDLNTLMHFLNQELIYISHWLKANKLTLNTKKSKYIIFSTSPKLTKVKTEQLSILKINNQALANVEEIKFLGVLMKNNLKWNSHINMIANKVSRSVAILNKTKHCLPIHSMKMLYNSLITPYLNYCINVWGSTEKGNLYRLFLLQKRAVRYIFNAGYLDHTKSMFEKLQILEVHKMVQYKACIFMFNFFHNKLPLPFKNYFPNLLDMHNYNTRQNNQLRIQKFRTEIFRKSIIIYGPTQWNLLPENIRNITSKNHFKRQLKEFLLS